MKGYGNKYQMEGVLQFVFQIAEGNSRVLLTSCCAAWLFFFSPVGPDRQLRMAQTTSFVHPTKNMEQFGCGQDFQTVILGICCTRHTKRVLFIIRNMMDSLQMELWNISHLVRSLLKYHTFLC